VSASEFANAIQFCLLRELLRERALPRAFVAVAGREVRIGEKGKSLAGLIEALRGCEVLDGFLRTLGAQKRKAEIAMRSRASIELQCFFIRRDGLLE
jgi:hypothetical protein